jgi:type II secretory pathway pseudopilin PulG
MIYKMTYKKGAMFGLDARIALAIFGALSVISGAALFSAIQESKLTATYTGMQEILKSYEALYLDTGSLRTLSSDKTMFDANDLITDNSMPGWSGPYIDGNAITAPPNIFLENTNIPDEYDLRIRNVKTTSWQPSDTWGVISCANKTDSCVLALQLKKDAIDTSLGKLIDDRFDDGVADTGSIRYGSLSGVASYIFIMGFTYNAI